MIDHRKEIETLDREIDRREVNLFEVNEEIHTLEEKATPGIVWGFFTILFYWFGVCIVLSPVLFVLATMMLKKAASMVPGFGERSFEEELVATIILALPVALLWRRKAQADDHAVVITDPQSAKLEIMHDRSTAELDELKARKQTHHTALAAERQKRAGQLSISAPTTHQGALTETDDS